jgi:acyl-homoserine-lactone acylase
MSGQSRIRLRRASRCTFAALALVACDSDTSHATSESVALRYTEYGIPHILTQSLEGAGFGQGYAQARDNACEIARGMLGFSGELSRHFGPDAPGSSMALVASSLDSDVYFRQINESGVIEGLLAEPPPLGPSDEVREIVRGFVAGFNRFLAEPNALSCADAEWLRPMAELDVYRRAYAVTLLMGQGGYFAGGIVSATPPLASEAPPATARLAATQRAASALPAEDTEKRRPGSNAIALGAAATRAGGGINVANPHLGWDGDMRWWQAQLTVPGRLDVSGAALIGMPLVVMGHTASVSWSITTTEQSHHFTVFELELVDGEPTSYWVDGSVEPMQRRDVRVEVRRPDGSLDTVTRALWWTRYGPVVGAGAAIPLPPWSAGSADEPGHAYVMADANAGNLRMLDTLLAFNQAASTEDVLRAIREVQGVPWWSVVAADADGQALWSQVQVLANVPDEHAERCSTEAGRAYFAASRIPMLDGSRSECAWRSDPDAVAPGIFGPGSLEHPRLPYALSDRYLENSNDSHWLPSAGVRIEGMPRIVGDEGSERSLRTRGAIAQLEEALAREPFTRQSMQDLVLSNRSYSADLALDESVALCRELEGGLAQGSNGEPVDVRAACDALARWDHRMATDSRGALLFSRYWTRALGAAREQGVSPWRVPFDVNDPVGTPHTLDTSAPFVAQALADAVLELDAAGIPVDAPLGDYQYAVRDGVRLPIGGGSDDLAVINLLAAPFGPAGFTEPFYGPGYLHVVALERGRCPDAVTLLTYSQSADPSSPHHADQTELFSQGRWVTDRFCESDILASPALEVIELETAAPEQLAE